MFYKLLLSLVILVVTGSTTLACTDFRIIAKDTTVLVTRSMEYALDLHSNIRNSPRGRLFKTILPNGKQGISWTAKYGYLYLDGMQIDSAVDGLNEAGLAFEALYLPNETHYQTVEAGHEMQGLAYYDFGHWILSNFKTVAEVRQAVPKILVFAQKIPGIGDKIFPLHFAIHDASGKSLVIEYIGGNLKIYDNKIGVLTNSPTYDWQVTNLSNYLNLTTKNPESHDIEQVTFSPLGQGAGMHGLPGDVSPPSRFVKIAILLNTAFQPSNAMEALNLGEHLINNIDIPRGFVQVKTDQNNYITEATQWVVFKDLTHKLFYYRTYNNMTLHRINMNKIDFSQPSKLFEISLNNDPYFEDVTNKFR